MKALPNSDELFTAWVSKDPEVGRFAQFMSAELQPAMGRLLSKTVFDPATGTGEVSCVSCHNLVDAGGKIAPPPTRQGHEPEGHVQ